jgi:hypothetical protein
VPHLKTLFKPKSLDVPSRVEFFERAAEVIPDLAEIISQLSDEDVDYVLDACLAVVQVKQERGWSQVVSNGILMFQSADLKTQLQLTAEVVKFNLSDFFDSSQPKEPDALRYCPSQRRARCERRERTQAVRGDTEWREPVKY